MTINDLLARRGLSKYALSKLSGVPYTTLNDLCSGKSEIAKATAGTVVQLARALGVTVEDLLATDDDRCDFELFKSNACHSLKRNGDWKFVAKTYGGDEIRSYFVRGWYPECLYLLAMADYISRINGLPQWAEYDNLREIKLSEPLYPMGILLKCSFSGSDEPKRKALIEAIPEFLRHNIVEADVRNVV